MKQLKITLSAMNDFSVNAGSVFHGALMQRISPEASMKLHECSLRPYSQYLSTQDDKTIWTVSAISDYGEAEVINPLENLSGEIYLEYKDISLKILNKEENSLSYEKLFCDCMKNSDRKISVKIMTPISFKSNDSYINIPDLRLIYNSLLRRFNEFSEQSFIPMETIDQLVDASDLAYRLRSTFYHLEGVRIKAFTGSFTVYLYGTPQIIQLANMLFRFAEYSGIGIKTTLGMGAVKLEKGEISG